MTQKTDTYKVTEKVGDNYYRPPSSITKEEYEDYMNQKMAHEYWKEKNKTPQDPNDTTLSEEEKKEALGFNIPMSPLAERYLGEGGVNIKPNGNVLLDFGYKLQTTRDPRIPVPQQTQGLFNFDQTIQLSLKGTVGEKGWCIDKTTTPKLLLNLKTP